MLKTRFTKSLARKIQKNDVTSKNWIVKGYFPINISIK